MNFFNKWFAKKCREAWEQAREEKSSNMLVGSIEKGAPEGSDTVRFEISSAVGGKIVTVRRHNLRNDKFDQQTYIIPAGEDIGTRVAKIINLEQFRS